MNNKIFSFDAETNGLWGDPFTVAAIVYELQSGGNWVEMDRFIARLSNDAVSDQWSRKNVLPALATMPVTHNNHPANPEFDYAEMLSSFATFYHKHRLDADIICHMGYIVEAHLLREMYRLGFIGTESAPYPLYDVSGNLQQAGEDPLNVDKYAAKYNLQIVGTTHNPLYDCEVAAKVYIHLLNKS